MDSNKKSLSIVIPCYNEEEVIYDSYLIIKQLLDKWINSIITEYEIILVNNGSSDNTLEEMQKIGVITHCPMSNRLLGNGKLNIENIENLTIATDGLSSNNSLSLWDELRVALCIHNSIDIHTLATKLIKSVTIESAKALGFNNGVIERDRDADLIVVPLNGEIKDEKFLATMMILHTQNVKEMFINGNGSGALAPPPFF